MKIRAIIFTLLIAVSTARAEGISFLVNAENPVTSQTRAEVADYFLKRVKQWPDGIPLRFFDRVDGSEERRTFLKEILKKSTRDIELYWIGQKLYSGHSAPSQVSSDLMTEIMVSKFPGAIGYVSNDYVPTRSVKKISITGQ